MTDVETGEKPLRPRAWCRARRTILNRERRIGCQISGRRAANAEIDRVLCPISFPIAVAESRRNGEGGGGRAVPIISLRPGWIAKHAAVKTTSILEKRILAGFFRELPSIIPGLIRKDVLNPKIPRHKL